MSPSRDEAVAAIRARAARREAIATAILAARIGGSEFPWMAAEQEQLEACVTVADRLIAELDRRRLEEEAQA